MLEDKRSIRRILVTPLSPICLRDVAWLGGLLEGEGCFASYKGLATIKLQMTDLDTVERAAAMLGIKRITIYPHKNAHYKPYCHANLFGNPAIGWMMTLYPFLGLRRQAKVREVIAKWQRNPGRGARESRKTHCPQGHPYDEANTIIRRRYNGTSTSRHCRLCVRAHKRAHAQRKRTPVVYQGCTREELDKMHEELGQTPVSPQEGKKGQLELWQI